MADRLPPLGDLHAFAVVGETRSLTRAAERLNVTQPAVSKRIRALEAWLGLQLVERGANRIVLTRTGAQYATAIREGFSVLQGATDALLKPPPGPLRVRAYTTWALRWLIPRLPRYYGLKPDHPVEVTTSLQPVDFAHDPVDVAVRMGPAENSLAGATRLQRQSVSPYATPAVAAAAGHDFAEATLLSSLARPRDWAVWAAARGVVLPASVVSFESTSLAIQAALQGIGVVVCAPMLVEEDVRLGRPVPLDSVPVETEDYYWLLLPPGRVRPDAVLFSGWLLHEISLVAPG
ncbi:MAG TPA: LysR family transcriptional regulator [Falsiroseomonas sp.]|jgi:LysR family glycine cleavage system transcriptional activator|nr:LysR family transcriptional regulator [Falsiroseomonas sp.]